jgi:hypothetical protein
LSWYSIYDKLSTFWAQHLVNDDGTLISDQENIFQDLESIISRSKDIGLELNITKCELAVTSNDKEERNKILGKFNFIAPGLSF